MKRLLVFTENYVFGGGNRYLVEMVNGVAARFDDVVIMSNPKGLFTEELQHLTAQACIKGVPVVTWERFYHSLRHLKAAVRIPFLVVLLPLQPFLFIYNLFLCLLLLLKTRPAAVLCCNGGYPGGQSVRVMLLASSLLRIPAALSVVSMPMPARCRLLSAVSDRLVWKAANTVIVNAGSIAEALHKQRGLPPDKVNVVYTGIEDTMAAAPPKTATSRSQIIIGCLTRMDRAKGILYLIEAFSKLILRYPDLKLVLAGKEGDAAQELLVRIEQPPLKGRVQYLGYYNGNIGDLLKTYDIYVFPTTWEGFPYSIVEAMMVGCPIVTTSVGGIPEAIRNGEEGLLVEPGSAESLEHTIERLVLDENLRSRLGKNARRRFKQDFTRSTMHTRMRTVLTKAGLIPFS